MKKTYVISWIPIIIALLSVIGVYLIPQFSLWFLILLSLNLIVALIYRKHYSMSAIALCRTLIGLLFVFSGFVKGVDPLGTQFKMIDYLDAYGMSWMNDFTLVLSIFMILAEFIVGVALVLNTFPRLATLGATLLMIFFTITTFFDATMDLVPDCGCFGTAVIMTNWQTFYKNIIIDTILICLIFNNKSLKGWFSIPMQFAIPAFIGILFIGFQIHNLNHLPVIDFMQWKVGTKMSIDENQRQPVTTYVIYKNNQTGETKEYVSPNYPYNDPEWVANWTFVDSRVEDPNPRLYNLIILDNDGGDQTEYLLNGEVSSIIATSYKLEDNNYYKTEYLESLYRFAENNGMNFVLLVSSENPEEEIQIYREKTGAEYDIYNVDDVELKMIVRSNPGLFIMKSGVILGKWGWRDFPTIEKIETLIEK